MERARETWTLLPTPPPLTTRSPSPPWALTRPTPPESASGGLCPKTGGRRIGRSTSMSLPMKGPEWRSGSSGGHSRRRGSSAWGRSAGWGSKTLAIFRWRRGWRWSRRLESGSDGSFSGSRRASRARTSLIGSLVRFSLSQWYYSITSLLHFFYVQNLFIYFFFFCWCLIHCKHHNGISMWVIFGYACILRPNLPIWQIFYQRCFNGIISISLG